MMANGHIHRDGGVFKADFNTFQVGLRNLKVVLAKLIGAESECLERKSTPTRSWLNSNKV